MCYFVTVGVNEDNASWLLDSIPRGMAIYPYANKSITKHLPKSYRTYVITSGMCSCDLFRRSFENSPSAEEHTDRLRLKYEKKGWTPAKIQRAIDQSSATQPLETFVGLCPDLRKLLADIVERVDDMALVVHFYHEREIENEKIAVSEGELIPVDSFVANEPVLTEDRLVFIQRRGKSRKNLSK